MCSKRKETPNRSASRNIRFIEVAHEEAMEWSYNGQCYNSLNTNDYNTYLTLYDNFQNIDMPKEMTLENKYVMNRGINAGTIS